ncbi:MAG TPA: carbohydrate binding family 9 domain-containing protein, partial [Puia sp.]|nr:carbohydrate binding family 9 domain-containing protein [Puia sp.]
MKFLFTIVIVCTILPCIYSQDIVSLKPDPIILLTHADTIPSGPSLKIKEIRAVKIENKINVDGILNEPEWALAPASPHFIQIEPEQGKSVHFETKIKVLYNKFYLYVGIIALDTLGKKAIMATDFIRDFDITRHDLVSLAFDGFNDHRNAMSFVTNAYGVQKDLLSFDDLYYDINWDGLWRVRTNRTDSGWTAEIAIPWQTLRYPKSKDSIQSWGFNVYRNRRLSNEISAFSEFPHAYSSLRMNYAGKLTNLQPPP